MVAYLHGAPTKVLAGYPNKKTRKIAWLHTDMRRSTLNRIFFSKDEIIKTFNLYDRIVGVSSTVSNSFIDMYGLKEKVVVKYNTNNIREIIRLSKEQIEEELFPKNTFTIISIGSLTKVKGYSRLLSICKKLFDEGVKFKLYILGKGSEEKKLQDFINKNNLSKKITLLGFKKNPYPYLKKATLFVCSSIYEGLSTVISEAIILGVPVISTRVSGAEEVLGINNEYGIVVENNQEALYQGLKELIKSPKKVEYYKKKASERATFFDTEKRVKEVEDMFDEVLR
jgi:glycosyltransferase involved in cell wall biosynthesis